MKEGLELVNLDYVLRTRSFTKRFPERVERELSDELTALASYLHAKKLHAKAEGLTDKRERGIILGRLERFTDRPDTPLLEAILDELSD
jgi:hypothetical protein